MAELRNREVSINLGGNVIATRNEDGRTVPILRVVFDIDLHLEKEPNTASIQVFNFKEETRANVATKGLRTTIEAGYVGRTSTIFDGTLDYGHTTRDGHTWSTEFQSTDGGDELRKARINEAMARGTTLEQALKRAADQVGIGLGNIVDKIKEGNIRGAMTEFSGGIVMSGSARDEIDRIMKLAGYGWSVQQRQFQALGPSDFIAADEVLSLSPSSGMVGSPQPGDDGNITIRAKLLPDLLPGRKIDVSSALVDGFFRIEAARFTGDTWGDAWGVDVEAKPL